MTGSTPSRDDYLDVMLRLEREQAKDAFVGDWLVRRVLRGQRWLFVADHYTGCSTPSKAHHGEIATLMRAIDLGLQAIKHEEIGPYPDAKDDDDA